jgi:alcohol dehydrogenase class IV
MRFDFATATRIMFGIGTLQDLGSVVGSFGQHALVVTGSNPQRAEPVLGLLRGKSVAYTLFPTSGEPSVETARLGKRTAQESNCQFVIAIGGGSVIDTGKAIAALVTNPGDPLDYLEVIGRGQPITQPSLPFIAIPTTSGTGSEVTINAVLYSPEHRMKVSLRSPLMVAKIAVVDSSLTHSSPSEVTAQSGLDALTQVIEPYVSNKANPLTDSLCETGIKSGALALQRAYEQPDDSAARDAMALTSLFGGMALANAKLGAVHGFAGPFGGMFDAPHGGICARLLPFVMEMNVRALQERQPESPILSRFDTVARWLTGSEKAVAVDGIRWVDDVVSALQIRPLSAYGLTETDIPTLIEKAAVASSMQGNPIKLTAEELTAIIRAAI